MSAPRPRIQNPYTNRMGIRNQDDFFGRSKELRNIYTRIRGEQCLYLVGERRIGKSSILNALDFPVERQRFEIPEEVVFAQLDMQFIAGCTEELFLQNLLAEISEKLDISPMEPSRQSLERIAKGLGSNRRLVLLLDEFSVLVHNPNIPQELLDFLRAWSARFRISIIGAFREASLQTISEGSSLGSPFLNIFDKIYIGPLLAEDARDLVEMPAASVGVQFEEEEIRWVFELAGYFPLFLQMACYHLLELKYSRIRGAEARTRLERDFLYEVQPHFDYLFDGLPDQEKNALLLVAGGRAAPEDLQKELVKKGLLVQEDGKTQLFSRVLPTALRSYAKSSKKGFLSAILE
jgi:AAA+ ATPase superfamily predicted ATPase